ncbi:MAG: hypothetical protein P1V81_16585 [Planctomycetota bacterium]|nr:hypothetical protein [Planctomycetota bacterium]
MRALLALLIACGGLGISLFSSGLTAKNHASAQRLHVLQRECELRRAAITNMRVQVRGRVAGDPRAVQRALAEQAAQRALVQAVQDGSGVSGSSSLGGSPSTGPGASFTPGRYTP